MKAVITGSLVALAISVTAAAAQDKTVKSETKVKTDDGQTVVMRGCLQQTAAGNGFVLLGGVTAAGDDLTSKSKVKTDVDDDKTTVKGKSATTIDDDQDAVATSGSETTYAVTPRSGIDLASHAGEEVELGAVLIDARKGDDKKADVKVKEDTKIDRDSAPDSKIERESKAEVARGPLPQLMAVSVRPLGRSCGAQ
jgi:hypothetical protein